MLRRRSTRSALFAVLVLAVVLDAGLGLAGLGQGLAPRVLFTGVELAALGLCCARVVRVAHDRAAWAALATYMALWTAADLGWTVHFDALAEPPFPNWTDAVYLSSYIFAYVGQTLLLVGRLRRSGMSLWLDGIVGGLAASALGAALAFGPFLDAGDASTTAVAVTVAYPTFDLLLLCLVGMTFAVTGWRPGRAWAGIGVSLVLTVIADFLFSYLTSSGRYVSGGVVDALWPAAMVALAWGAWQAPAGRRIESRALVAVVLPTTFAALALGVVVLAQLGEVPLTAALLADAALLAAAVRGTLTFGEHLALLGETRAEALTDGLTELPNRRRLMLDLQQAADRASLAAPRTLIFFDLDGFKAYNDSFGHVAGDALLARLGGALAAAMRGSGTAYRVGGDEFCVLLDGGVTRSDGLVRRAAAALQERGEAFTIGASFGTVTLPAEAESAEDALQLADARMYEDKAGHTRGARGQARDLLMTVLKEREPGLEQHVGEVAALALAVARRLGMPAEELDEVARGAELHDVGKLAVPDSVLHKPGPLDDDEWAIMRQHTLTGERMLLASPALRPVARLVRSSHERWDGAGYPDRLAGTAIPLGSRIICACDALHAMLEHRPYADPRTTPEAIHELRRCAGTQFDPDVVEHLAAVAVMQAAPALQRR